MPVLLKKKISINRSEQRRMGGGSAQLQPLSEIEELAVALVGHDSRLVTTRGVAEPSLVSRQPDTVVSLQPSTPPAPSAAAITSEEEEEEDEPISVEQEEEEANIFVGAEEPAAISIEMDEAPRPNGVQVATPRRDILHTPTPRRSGQRGEQSPTLNGQTECLISLCRETVMIGRDLIQGFEGFSTNWSQFSTNWSQFSTNWSQFNTNFSNWSSMQTEIARETLEAIREQTAATIALQHVLLAGHGTAPQGVVSARSEHSPSTRASTEDAVPPDSEVVPQVSASTLSPPPQQEVLPSHAAHCVRVEEVIEQQEGAEVHQRRPCFQELSSIEERAAALVGTDSHSATTRGLAEPMCAPQAPMEPPRMAPVLEVLINTGGEEDEEENEQETSETEEELMQETGSTGGPAVAMSSSSNGEVAGPSSVQRSLVPSQTQRRLGQRGEHAPTLADHRGLDSTVRGDRCD